jgi:aerobic-type carbon monoxide dehydrogenase small subunit (CoxS/CutS family)
MPRFRLDIDGRAQTIEADNDQPLLYALRELKFRGPKFGCGLAQCGACTVIVDGQPIRSCVIPVAALDGKAVRTLDGLSRDGEPHPVQAAFIEEEAAQCGYCTNGWIMTAVASLERNPNVSDADIRSMFTGLKCRCGTHMSIMRAVRRAADQMAADSITEGHNDV